MRRVQRVQEARLIAALATWWSLDRTPGSRVLHVWLHAIATAHVVELRNLLRKSVGERWVIGIEHEICSGVRRAEDLPAVFSRRVRRGLATPEAALVEVAAMLRAVDTLHATEALWHHGLNVVVPDELGGGESLLLGPPEDGLLELTPEERHLVRGSRHRGHVVRDLLGLSFHVRDMDTAHRVVVDRLPAPVAATLRRTLRRQSLKIGVATCFRGLRYRIVTRPELATERFGVPFWFEGLDDADRPAAVSEIEAVLDAARREKVAVLLFPELSMDDALLVALKQRLGADSSTLPALIVAGSAHVMVDGQRRNRSTVLDADGDVLWVQDKQVPFEAPVGRSSQLGLGDRAAVEDIEASDTLVVVDGALGRMAVPICLDYCGVWLRELLVELGVNTLLVPASTPRMRDFTDRARELGTDGRATTVVANSSWLLARSGRVHEAVALLYMPIRDGMWTRLCDGSTPLVVFNINELLAPVELLP